MKRIHIDTKTGREITWDEAHSRSYIGGFISWPRLTDMLRQAGQLRPSERVELFDVGDDGLTFRVTTEK